LQDLARYGAIYRELIERKSGSALANFSKRLLPWDVTTVFPLVLRLWAADIEEAEKADCFDMILSLIVRRGVCGLTTKNYNKFFLSAVAYLDESGWGAGPLASFLLAQTSETGRFPRDEEFQSRWLSSPAYTVLQPARTRAVLEEIELAKRTKYHETTALAAQLSVEHVMPRQWEKTWPLADGTMPTSDQLLNALFANAEDDSPLGRIVKRNRLKDSFGNLTLLTKPLNSSVSNGPFAQKRAALDEHSLLVLNREIIAKDLWNEDVIIARGQNLFALAKVIWKLPQSAAAAG
jgi:hypothetical protein